MRLVHRPAVLSPGDRRRVDELTAELVRLEREHRALAEPLVAEVAAIVNRYPSPVVVVLDDVDDRNLNLGGIV